MKIILRIGVLLSVVYALNSWTVKVETHRTQFDNAARFFSFWKFNKTANENKF
jgi:hypothetical protein